MDEADPDLYFFDMHWENSAFKIREAHGALCAPDWHWEHGQQNRDYLMLWLVRRGRGRFWISPRGELALQPRDCFLLRMWEACRATHEPRHPLEVWWVMFQVLDESGRPVVLAELPEDDLPPVHRRLNDAAFLISLMERVAAAHQSGAKAEAGQWLGATLLELAREDARPTDGPRAGAHYDAIRAAAARIRANPAEPWSVAALAREIGMSPEHFSRLFRRYEGRTPRRFIVRTRIDAARSLLSGSAHPVARIAEILGYGDVYHFSRQFHAETGVTPSVYRRGG